MTDNVFAKKVFFTPWHCFWTEPVTNSQYKSCRFKSGTFFFSPFVPLADISSAKNTRHCFTLDKDDFNWSDTLVFILDTLAWNVSVNVSSDVFQCQSMISQEKNNKQNKIKKYSLGEMEGEIGKVVTDNSALEWSCSAVTDHVSNTK